MSEKNLVPIESNLFILDGKKQVAILKSISFLLNFKHTINPLLLFTILTDSCCFIYCTSYFPVGIKLNFLAKSVLTL